MRITDNSLTPKKPSQVDLTPDMELRKVSYDKSNEGSKPFIPALAMTPLEFSEEF